MIPLNGVYMTVEFPVSQVGMGLKTQCAYRSFPILLFLFIFIQEVSVALEIRSTLRLPTEVMLRHGMRLMLSAKRQTHSSPRSPPRKNSV